MLNINRKDDSFELSHAGLPAPLLISLEAGREFAKALASPDLKVAAWKVDKLVWADPDRAPIGVWVTQAGQPQIWIMGQTIDISADDAAKLGLSIMIDTAKHQIGDEVQSLTAFDIFDEASGDHVRTLHATTVFVVKDIHLTSAGAIAYTLEAPSNPGLTTQESPEAYIRVADPVSDWTVSQNGYLYSYRRTTVSARSATEARDLATAHFKKVGDQVGWDSGTWEPSGIDEINRVEGTPVELAAKEGWVLTGGAIAFVTDGPFANNDAAFQFVLDKAFAGSKRHQEAIRAIV